MRKVWLFAALLGGCAQTQPLVNMTDVDPVAYQRDLDRCSAVGQGSDLWGPVLVGVVTGGTLGVGIGALWGGLQLTETTTTAALAYGGEAGAVAGIGPSVQLNKAAADTAPSPDRVPTVSQCLAAQGYKVLPAQ